MLLCVSGLHWSPFLLKPSPGKLVFLDVLINKIALIIIWLVQGHDENKKKMLKGNKMDLPLYENKICI